MKKIFFLIFVIPFFLIASNVSHSTSIPLNYIGHTIIHKYDPKQGSGTKTLLKNYWEFDVTEPYAHRGYISSIKVTEPATMLLLGAILVILAAAGRRKLFKKK